MTKARHPYQGNNKIPYPLVFQESQYVEYSTSYRVPTSVIYSEKWLVSIGCRKHTCTWRLAWLVHYSMRCEMTSVLPISAYYISIYWKFCVLFNEKMFVRIKCGSNANILDFVIQPWNNFWYFHVETLILSADFQNK